MTLLGVILTSNNRVFGIADGRAEMPGELGMGSSFERDKFNKSDSHPLMWGIIGDPESGLDFGPWLDDAYTVNSQETWPTFSNLVKTAWSEITSMEVRRVRSNFDVNQGVLPQWLNLPSNCVVVTGFINGGTGVVATSRGGSATYHQPGVYFFGPWRQHVYAAWKVVQRRENVTLGDFATLRDLLEPICDALEHLYLPVNIWELFKDGQFKKLANDFQDTFDTRPNLYGGGTP